MIDEKNGSFRTIYDLIGSKGNKLTLKILSHATDGSIYTKEILNMYGLTKQTINSSVKRLIVQEIIDREHDKYYFTDKLFGMWLKQI